MTTLSPNPGGGPKLETPDWPSVKLRRLASVVSTKATEKTFELGLEDIESWTGRLVTGESTYEAAGVAFEKDDVLFGKLRPYLAKAYQAEQQGQAVGDFIVLRPSRNVHPRFLTYNLLEQRLIDRVTAGAYGSKMPRTNWDDLGSQPILLPPFEEQCRIAAFLDHETARIDELVREQERLQRLIEERRHSAIAFFVARGLDPEAPLKGSGVESVGAIPQHWQVKKLKHIGRLVTGTTPGNLSVADGVSSGLPWVRPDDFSLREGSVAPRVHLPPALAREVRPIPAGSSLISCIGRIGLTVQTSVRLATNQQITAVIPISVHERYLYYALNSIKGELERNAVGNVLSILNASRLSEISIPLPPVSEQSAIANYLDDEIVQLEALYSEQAKSISLLRERRSALISAAVTGQLDLSDWQLPEPEAVAEVA